MEPWEPSQTPLQPYQITSQSHHTLIHPDSINHTNVHLLHNCCWSCYHCHHRLCKKDEKQHEKIQVKSTHTYNKTTTGYNKKVARFIINLCASEQRVNGVRRYVPIWQHQIHHHVIMEIALRGWVTTLSKWMNNSHSNKAYKRNFDEWNSLGESKNDKKKKKKKVHPKPCNHPFNWN